MPLRILVLFIASLTSSAASTGCTHSCSRILDIVNAKEDISSPCHPRSYLNNLACTTNMQSDGVNLTQIEITTFKVEPWHDYVKLAGGTEFLLFVDAETNKVLITGFPISNLTSLFSTDSGTVLPGFKATVRGVSESEVLEQYNGYHADDAAQVIKSPVYLSSSGESEVKDEPLDLVFISVPNTTNSPIEAWSDYATLLSNASAVQTYDVTATGFVVNWTEVAGSVSYNVTVSSSIGKILETTIVNSNETQYTFTGLPSGSMFTVSVRAIDKLGNVGTLTGNATTDVTAPTGFRTSKPVYPDRFTLIWDKVDGATSYKLSYTSDNSSSTEETTTATTLEVNSLSPGTLYRVRLVAVFPVGQSSPVFHEQITVPGNINDLSIPEHDIGTANFTPTWSSIKGASFYVLNVYKKSDPSSKFSVNVTIGQTIGGLDPGITYIVNVTAGNSAGNGATATTEIKTKLVPSTATVETSSETSESFVVQWTAINEAMYYDVHVKEDRNLYAKTERVSKTENQHTFTGLPSGSYFNVTLSVFGEEDVSNLTTISAATAVKKVENINVDEVSQTSFVVSWSQIIGASRYHVNVPGVHNDSSDKTTMKIDSLTAGTRYTIEIIAFFPVANSEPTTKFQFTAPNKVTNLQITDIKSNSFTPTWTNAFGATSYLLDVKRKRDDQKTITNKIVSRGNVVTGVKPGTTYLVDVVSVISIYRSSAETKEFTTVLPQPQNFQITSITKNRFLLMWDETDGAESYEYSCKEKGSNIGKGSDNVKGTQIAVENLQSDTEYTCWLAAVTQDRKSTNTSKTETTAQSQCAKTPCQHGGRCEDLQSGFKCYCERGYEGDNCETEIDYCTRRTTPCAGNATCINEHAKHTSRCQCDEGFTGDPSLRCVAFCAGETKHVDNETLTFQHTRDGMTVYSDEKCKDADRSKASAVCVTSIENDKVVSKYPHSKIIVVKCDLTIGDVTVQVNKTTTEVTSNELNKQSQQLQVLTSGDKKLEESDVEKVAEYINDVGNIAEKNKDAVTTDVLSGIMHTTDNLIKSGSISVSTPKPTETPVTQKPGEPPKPTPTQSPVSAAQKEKEIKKKILNSLTVIAEQVIIPNNTNEIVIETENMIVKVLEAPVLVIGPSGEEQEPPPTSFAPVIVEENSSPTSLTGPNSNKTNTTIPNNKIMLVPINITIPHSALEKANKKLKEQKLKKRNVEDDEKVRISFFLHKDDTLFPSNQFPEMIVAANLGNNLNITNLPDDVTIKYNTISSAAGFSNSTKPLHEKLTEYECVFWDFNTGSWSGEGCCIDTTDDNLSTCRCNHLTNYALLVSKSDVKADVVLDIVSKIGCILSCVGLVCTIIVHCIKEDIRKRRPTQLLLHICACLFVSYIIFMTGITATDNDLSCITVAALMQYFFLATWCWMSVYANDMYMSLVKVFNTNKSKYMTKCVAFAYGVPLLITILNVVIAVGVLDGNHEHQTFCDNANNDAKKYVKKNSSYVSENMCWIHDYSLYIGFLLPVGLMLVFNIFVYGMVMKTLLNRGDNIQSSAKKTSAKDNFLISVTLSAGTGITWAFGYLMLLSDDETFLLITSWIFTVLNTIQGLVIFFTTCVRHENMRKIWWKPISNTCCGACARLKFLSPKRDEFNLAGSSDTGGTSFVSGTTENTKNTMVSGKSIIPKEEVLSESTF